MSGAPGQPTRILILGGGFGGVATAQGLAKAFKRDRSVEITLVNRDNHFLYVPLLASAAAGSLEALHVVAPIRAMLKGVNFRAEEILGIDLARRVVTTGAPESARERELPFDHLVLALGNIVNLSTLPGVAQHGKTLKTLGDAFAIRNHTLKMLEMADIETDPVARREMLTFVVAGGGFSGVEMVGELNDLTRGVLHQYPSITPDQLKVILLHSQDRILPEMSAGIADYALQQLRKRGVEVRLKVRLGGATPHEALLQDGTKIPTRTLIVAVGNAPPPVLNALPIKKERGRIVVDEYMRVPDAPGVWALGDNAIVPNRAAKDGATSPPTAQYALRQGKQLAGNIAASLRNGTPKPFAFGGLGLLCLVGHGSGVGELPGGIRVRGLIGWFLWRSVYWSKLPTFGRKVQIGAGWALDPIVPRDTAQINLTRTQTIGQAHYEPGEYIFRQGDPGDHFYLISSGAVEVVREHSSGRHEVLATLGKGEFFGETALLQRQRRNASIRCSAPTDVVTIGREDFATLAGTWLQFAEHLQERSEERVEAAPLTTFFNRFGALGQAPPPPAGGQMSYQGPPGAPPARLVRRDSGGEIVLDRDLLSFGRSSDNHIVVPDQRTSRRHALIQREGAEYWVEDLGAANGTYVNGARLGERVQLRHGDEITIGMAVFQFIAPPVPAAPPPVPVFAPPPTPVFAPPPAPSAPPEEGGSITRMINSLDRRANEPEVPRNAAAIERPDSITGIIQTLDMQGAAPQVRQAAGSPAARPPRRVFLQATGGPASGQTFVVEDGGAVLGRSRESGVPIPDDQLSRRHAQITFQDGAFWVRDLGSTNGTFVNHQRLAAPHRLAEGDEIAFGETRLAVHLDAG